MTWWDDEQKFKKDWKNLLATVARIDGKLTEALTALNRIGVEMSQFDDAFKALGDQVKANTDAEDAGVIVIQRLADMLVTNANDPQKVLDLAAALKAHADPLMAKVVENTPAA